MGNNLAELVYLADIKSFVKRGDKKEEAQSPILIEGPVLIHLTTDGSNGKKEHWKERRDMIYANVPQDANAYVIGGKRCPNDKIPRYSYSVQYCKI
jgi:hypothetical protein